MKEANELVKVAVNVIPPLAGPRLQYCYRPLPGQGHIKLASALTVLPGIHAYAHTHTERERKRKEEKVNCIHTVTPQPLYITCITLKA